MEEPPKVSLSSNDWMNLLQGKAIDPPKEEAKKVELKEDPKQQDATEPSNENVNPDGTTQE